MHNFRYQLSGGKWNSKECQNPQYHYHCLIVINIIAITTATTPAMVVTDIVKGYVGVTAGGKVSKFIGKGK